MASTPRGLVLPLLAALIAGGVLADVGRKLLVGPPSAPAPASTASERAESTATVAAGGSSPSRPIRDSAAVAARRAQVLRRLETEGGTTFLGAMLRSGDSTLRRWSDTRFSRPLRVAVVRRPVEGFAELYVEHVAWAIARWNSAALPVTLVGGADSASADIVVRWVPALDSGRTGRTDVTWDQQGAIRRAVVVLATHAPDGRRLDGPEMVALALHELGHALGLGHSDRRSDTMFPVTRSSELSERDRATARLLYSLPTGSLR